MARSIRIEYPGAFYHVMARGNRREAIFRDDEDRRFFLKTLAEACAMTGWRVHGWVLMGNHYHVLLETPEANLVSGMQWLQNTYTRRFNLRHGLWGRLFGDRYKSVAVEGGGYYYETLLDYVHLNPVRAGLVRPAEGSGVLDYPWSSVAGGYALPPRQRAKWLAAEAGLQAFGCVDTVAGRREFAARLDRRAVEEGLEQAGVPVAEEDVDARCSHLRRGWYWGSQGFAERVLKLGEPVLKRVRHRSGRTGGESRAHGKQEAERLLKAGLEAAGLTPEEVKRLPGSERRKVAIARVIWQQTTVNLEWLAGQLSLKSAANASQQMRRWQPEVNDLPKALRTWLKLSINVA